MAIASSTISKEEEVSDQESGAVRPDYPARLLGALAELAAVIKRLHRQTVQATMEKRPHRFVRKRDYLVLASLRPLVLLPH
jgi:hypothetical protein